MPWDRFSFPLFVRDGRRLWREWADKVVDLRLLDHNTYPPLPAWYGQPESGRAITVGAWRVTPRQAGQRREGTRGCDAVLGLEHEDGYRIGVVYTQTSGSKFPYSQVARTMPYLHALLSPARPSKPSARREARHEHLVAAASRGLDVLRERLGDPSEWDQAIEQDDDLHIADFVAWNSASVTSRLAAFELTIQGEHPCLKTPSGEFTLLAWERMGVVDAEEVLAWTEAGITPSNYAFLHEQGFADDPATVTQWRWSPAHPHCAMTGEREWKPRSSVPFWRVHRDAGWTPGGLRILAAQLKADLNARIPGPYAAVVPTLVQMVARWEALVGGAAADGFLRAGFTYDEVASAAPGERPDVETLRGFLALGNGTGDGRDPGGSSLEWLLPADHLGYLP